MTLRGDMVESFTTRECEIPLDGVEAIMGSSVRVRLKWEPQLLVRRKTQTSFMGTTRRMTTKMGTTAFNWSQPPKNTLSVEAEQPTDLKSRSIQSKLSSIIDSTTNTKPLSTIQQTSSTSQQTLSSRISPGLLTVYVIEARDLKGDIDRLNPQVLVFLGKHNVLKTKKTKKTVNPYWNESFSQELSGEEIHFELKLRDAHTFHSTEIGVLSNSLWDFIQPPFTNSFEKWLPLQPPGSGEVHLKISYVVKE